MKVAVLGAGALGTLLGGLLADTGNDVWLVHHREEYVRQINDNGVQIEGESLPNTPISVDVPATTNANEVGSVDLCLVLVRSHQTRDALAEHSSCIGTETRVLTLQNGLTTYDTIREIVGDQRALAGVTYVGAELESPGVVRNTNMGTTTFGGSDRAFSERLSNQFQAAGIDVTVVDDPQPHIWDKQMVSIAFKPIASLTQLSNGPIVQDENLRTIIENIVSEAQTVARERGIRLLTDDPVARIVRIGDQNPNHRSSMLQDVMAHRKTEIDDINGAIVAYAEQAGIDVPYNRMLTSLVHALERSYLDEV